MATSEVLTTLNTPKGLHPDSSFLAAELVPEALLFNITTQSVPVEGDEPVVRVPFVKEDPAISFVAEGAEIPEASPDLDEVLVHTQKLGVISRHSRESVSHEGVENFISTSMRRAITVKANNALLASAASPTGLLSTAGIVDGGTLKGTNLDVLTDALTTIEANGATATHLVMDPKSWGKISKLKTGTDSNQLLLGSPAVQTERTLFGVPVIVTPQMAEGSILALDQSDIISSVGDIKFTKSTEAYFNRDSYGYRVTWRFGWNVIHPDRLAKITVSLDGAEA